MSPRWKRTIELANDGKPLTVWHRDGLQIAQDAVSFTARGGNLELVFHVYRDINGKAGDELGEAKTIHGAKCIAADILKEERDE